MQEAKGAGPQGSKRENKWLEISPGESKRSQSTVLVGFLFWRLIFLWNTSSTNAKCKWTSVARELDGSASLRFQFLHKKSRTSVVDHNHVRFNFTCDQVKRNKNWKLQQAQGKLSSTFAAPFLPTFRNSQLAQRKLSPAEMYSTAHWAKENFATDQGPRFVSFAELTASAISLKLHRLTNYHQMISSLLLHKSKALQPPKRDICYDQTPLWAKILKLVLFLRKQLKQNEKSCMKY